MAKADTDRDWEFFGSTDPYWAVLTSEQYHRSNLTEQTLEDFYQTGEAHVAFLFERIARHLDADFAPRSCLDFGCGVGRVVIPLARRGLSVVGVDVADSMLREARRRSEKLGLTNLRLVKGDDELSLVGGPFDLIHSYIVFQHIPCERGKLLFERLLQRLAPGGVGALHFTHATTPRHVPRRSALRKTFGFLTRPIRAKLRGPLPAPLPEMQMNTYDLNHLLRRLQQVGVSQVWLECTRDREEYGATLFFQKSRCATSGQG